MSGLKRRQPPARLKLTEPAARAAVEAAVAHGPRVLEAGVGTGLSLGYYPRDSFVCGVDLSERRTLPRARLSMSSERSTPQTKLSRG
jgi:hypothetical protein